MFSLLNEGSRLLPVLIVFGVLVSVAYVAWRITRRDPELSTTLDSNEQLTYRTNLAEAQFNELAKKVDELSDVYPECTTILQDHLHEYAEARQAARVLGPRRTRKLNERYR